MKQEPSSTPQLIQLKQMTMYPEKVIIQSCTQILLKIGNNDSGMTSCMAAHQKKFLFSIEETEEETPFLFEGEQYLFTTLLHEEGIYHLQCLNYPKIKCIIQVENRQKLHVQSTNNELKQTILGLTQVKQDNQQPQDDQNKSKTQTLKNAKEQDIQDWCQLSPGKSDYSDYQRMLTQQNLQYDILPNKYLKYFKQQFKLWRDFFQTETPQPESSSQKKSPLPQSSSQKKVQIVKKQKSVGQALQAMSDSLSFSEGKSEKAESAHLRSQQEISDMASSEMSGKKLMKKTNSEYAFSHDRQDKSHVVSSVKRKKMETNTSSPHQRTEQSQADTFVDWAVGWADGEGMSGVMMKSLGDRHLVKQWMTFMKNKFRVAQFMHGYG